MSRWTVCVNVSISILVIFLRLLYRRRNRHVILYYHLCLSTFIDVDIMVSAIRSDELQRVLYLLYLLVRTLARHWPLLNIGTIFLKKEKETDIMKKNLKSNQTVRLYGMALNRLASKAEMATLLKYELHYNVDVSIKYDIWQAFALSLLWFFPYSKKIFLNDVCALLLETASCNEILSIANINMNLVDTMIKNIIMLYKNICRYYTVIIYLFNNWNHCWCDIAASPILLRLLKNKNNADPTDNLSCVDFITEHYANEIKQVLIDITSGHKHSYNAVDLEMLLDD
ncbi:hypothetical protein RFI_27792 [Reticulomyxa filosa]|uniref:Uncharacterized protein n=1 Tax=Reticulomyxa filosa TaxID=46433 RepID=X6M7F1_RETFI|nr:hypothetical protein RFI_27792 [Reticulomyxa filosa]|eukprot:ETO09586.1 hypothetical protein RFI_27792 [Reticulomyxa filosa]